MSRFWTAGTPDVVRKLLDLRSGIEGTAGILRTVTAAVIFDLDGVLIDSESLWDQARRELVHDVGRAWPEGATETMMGMSSREWSAYLRDAAGVPLSVAQINERVVQRLLAHYRDHLPLLPAAADAVRRLAQRWPLGLASSSNRPVIDAVLRLAGLTQFFAVTVSSEEVPRGKPAPDVYLAAAEQLGVVPAECAVIEDSANGIRSGVAAGMLVVAVPNPEFPPPPEVLALARVVLGNISELTPEIVA